MSNLTTTPPVAPLELPTETFVSFAVFSAASLLFSLAMFHRYGSWKKLSLYVIVAVILGWWLSLMIVFVIPMDVMSSQYVQCLLLPSSPHLSCSQLLSHHPVLSFLDPREDRSLFWIWRVIYWSAYVSIWAVYPLLTAYANSPEFKQRKRWWGALKENLLYYGLLLFIGLLLMVYISIKTKGIDLENMVGTAILISNTFGLFLVIVLLSIGLVRIPRNIWRLSRRPVMLKHYMWHISDAHRDFEEAKRQLMKVYKIVRNADRSLSNHDHNRKYFELVLKSVPPEEYENVVIGEGDFVANYDGMVALHGKIISAQWDVRRTQAVYLEYLNAAIHLEDVLDHSRSKQSFWRSTIRWSFAPQRNYYGATIVNRVESWYYRYVEAISLKLLACFLALLSVVVIWTEVTIFTWTWTQTDLSIFSLLLGTAFTPFAIEMLVWIPITYIVICVFHSLFSVRVFSYYRFLPGQATNARTLLMSASYMGRLVPPLVFNYLLMIHCGDGPQYIRTSAYSGLMGSMQAFNIVGVSFTEFFPMVLVVLVALVMLNLGDKILALCRIKQFQFSENFDDNNISSGERILRTEREAMGRQYEMTDEEELEKEISMGINTEKIQFLTSAGNDDVSIPIQSEVKEYRPRKPRLPRGQAGLLRSLSETQESGLDGSGIGSSNEALIPKSSGGSSSYSSSGRSGGAGGAGGSRVGDDILDI